MPIATVERNLVIRQADADGLSPLLLPGEACQDKIVKARLWHFCTPDGNRFAIGGSKASPCNVRVDRDGLLSICGGTPEWSCGKGGNVRNYWIVTDGRWIDTRPE
jgi:hypothetical protein